MKGRYFLDEIDKYLYSTNSYEIYHLYMIMFYDLNIHILRSDNISPPDWTPLPTDYWQYVTWHGRIIYDFGG